MNRRNFLGGIVATAIAVQIPAVFLWRKLTPSGHWIYLSRENHGYDTVVGRLSLRGEEYVLAFLDDGINYARRMKMLMHSFNCAIYQADHKDGVTNGAEMRSYFV